MLNANQQDKRKFQRLPERLLERSEGYLSSALIKSYNEAVEYILLSKKIKIRTQMRGEADIGTERDVSDFNGEFMHINRDEATVTDHDVGYFTFGIIYIQIRSDSSREYGYTCSAVYICLSFEKALRSFKLDFDNRVEFFSIGLVGEINQLFHRRCENSSGPGIGIERGMNLGNFSLAFLTASSPVNISPRQITILWWEYRFTNSSKFAPTNLSLSKILFIIYNSSLDTDSSFGRNVANDDVFIIGDFSSRQGSKDLFHCFCRGNNLVFTSGNKFTAIFFLEFCIRYMFHNYHLCVSNYNILFTDCQSFDRLRIDTERDSSLHSESSSSPERSEGRSEGRSRMYQRC